MRTSSEMTCSFLIQLVLCQNKTMWFIDVEVEQETSAPPLKKNPGSAPDVFLKRFLIVLIVVLCACRNSVIKNCHCVACLHHIL